MSAKKFLISGGSGLLGSHVLSSIGDGDSNVISLSRSEIEPDLPHVRVVKHDFQEEKILSPGMTADRVLHLAQSRDYSSFPGRAQSVFDVNVSGTLQMLNYALRSGSKAFLLASTGGVYAPHNKNLEEDYPLLSAPPIPFYAASKISAELLAASFVNHFNITILRYFFIYGPGQDSEKLIPRLINKILRGEPIAVAGSDGARISPTFVDDAARITVEASRLGISGTFNVAGQDSHTIGEIARQIGKILGKSVSLEVEADARPTDYVASTVKGDLLFGPSATMLEKGLETVIEAHVDSAETI